KETKSALRRTYSKLDPVALLKDLEQLQDALWKHAWRQTGGNEIAQSESPSLLITIMPAVSEESQLTPVRRSRKGNKSPAMPASAKVDETAGNRKYRKTRKPRKPGKLHTWRTRKDPFENAIEEIETQFHRNQDITAKQLLTLLQKKFPGEFSDKQRRTLMRRLEKLRNSGDGPVIPAPVRRSYPKHINSRSKLSSEQWQEVAEEVTACFEKNENVSPQQLVTILQKKFPESVSNAQIPTLRRRLNRLRKAGVGQALLTPVRPT